MRLSLETKKTMQDYGAMHHNSEYWYGYWKQTNEIKSPPAPPRYLSQIGLVDVGKPKN